jgi:hypothetical protein
MPQTKGDRDDRDKRHYIWAKALAVARAIPVRSLATAHVAAPFPRFASADPSASLPTGGVSIGRGQCCHDGQQRR